VNLEYTHPFDELSWNAPIYLDGYISNLKGEKNQITNTTIQMLSFAINNNLVFHVMMTCHAI